MPNENDEHEAKAAEDARRAAEAKAAEDARRVAEAKAAEDARRAAEAKAAEDARPWHWKAVRQVTIVKAAA